jgi:hypothetical protein
MLLFISRGIVYPVICVRDISYVLICITTGAGEPTHVITMICESILSHTRIVLLTVLKLNDASAIVLPHISTLFRENSVFVGDCASDPSVYKNPDVSYTIDPVEYVESLVSHICVGGICT